MRTFFKLSNFWRRTPLIACLIALPTVASGQQQPSPETQQAEAGQRMQTGDGLLSIQANFPSEIRVGEQFTYDVTVRNTSDNAALHDIELRHRKGSGVSIESVDVQGQQQQNQQQQNGQRQDSQQNREQQSERQNQEQEQQQQGQQLQDGQSLTIDQLNPGESRTIRVTASVDSEGPVDACLLISSYTPAICLQSEAVKPELEIVKTAPEQSNQCDVIELRYAVKNDGTGTIERFEISDELAEGLRTLDGEEQLVFEVDGLKAGETREFVARVYANKTGEFKSRAVAKATDSDLQSRSQNVGPNVVGADLEVQVSGSDRVYSNRPVMFTAKVTNNGKAPAEDVQVRVGWPQEADLARISDPETQTQGSEGQQRSGSQQDQTPEIAQASFEEEVGNPNQSQNQDQSANQQEMEQEEFTISRLEPGQSAQFDFVIRSNGLERIKTRVEARSLCAIDDAEDAAESRAQATALTRIIRVPALQIYAVDGTDPVEVDGKVKYVIRVRNEGDIEDKQVRVTVNLPEGLQFESAAGPSEHKQENNRIVFEPVEELAAGDELEYTLTATPQKEGNVVFKADLESESLQTVVTAEEPTRLITAQSQN